MISRSIARKLPLAIVVLSLLVGLGIGVSGYVIASRTAEDLTFARLAGVAGDRRALLASYLDSRELAVITAARSETVQNALRDLHFGWIKLGEGADQQLTDAYIANNPFPVEQRDQLADAKLGTNYDSAHARIHPALKVLAESAGFQDIYLFDVDGRCLYSVRKGADFAGLFAAGGAFADTILGGLLHRLQDSGAVTVSMSDVAHYAPAGDLASAFMAAPVLDKRGTLAGFIAVRLPIEDFGAVINQSEGLGETGEVVIVGADHLLRNESRFSEQADILATRLDSPVLDAAMAAPSAKGRASGLYREGEMLLDAVPLAHGDLNWTIVTMMGAAEATAPVTAMGQTMLFSAIALLLLAGGAALVISRSIARPITSLTDTMALLAAGKLDLKVPHARRDDEIGNMARAVEVFRENALEIARMTDAEAERLLSEKQARAQMMTELQAAFGSVVESAANGDFSRKIEARFPDPELNALADGINSVVATVDRGLTETSAVLAALADADLTLRMEGEYTGAFGVLKDDLNRVADRLSEIVLQLRQASQGLRAETGRILEGSDDLSRRTAVQSSTIEQTSATMGQLANMVVQNAGRAAEASQLAASLMRVAEESGDAARQATHSMERITASSNQVSSIVGLIDDIAFQTNLLALNASVEAARAGDLGKGFAVVAVEVRRLAQSAATASADIKALIERGSEEVAGGTRLVLDVADKLQAVLAAARSSNTLIESIALESREQGIAIGGVNSAIRTLGEMTRSDVALVEHTNKAISESEAQVAELDRVVAIFNLGASPQRRPGAKAAA